MNAKKIITIGLMAVLLLCFIWLKTKNIAVKTDLTLSNIEALALNEGGENVMCIDVGTLDCPTTHRQVYFIRIFNEKK
jgi:hypothetical protein